MIPELIKSRVVLPNFIISKYRCPTNLYWHYVYTVDNLINDMSRVRFTHPQNVEFMVNCKSDHYFLHQLANYTWNEKELLFSKIYSRPSSHIIWRFNSNLEIGYSITKSDFNLVGSDILNA